MIPRPSRGLLLLASLALQPLLSFAASKPCQPVDQAVSFLNKDICISAHVYDVVELSDGTRFLDVCPPQTPDDQCRFTFISLREDRNEVGDLRRYRNMDVQVRGVIQSLRGRTGMAVSHARQFSGGPPKFRPNPRLARGFTGDQERAPLADPNLRPQGGGRSFMNRKERETLPH